MSTYGYKEHRRDLQRGRKKRGDFHGGIIRLAVGVCMLAYTFWILPFHAGKSSEIRGEEMTAGKDYYPEAVYYMEDLRLLRVKTNADSGKVYCIAEFLDRDQQAWIISFTPGRDRQLAEQIRLSGPPDGELDLTVSGYFLLEYMEDLPFEADAFYTVYGSSYADGEGQNMLGLNAEYLCKADDNYTLQALLRPGISLISLAVGVAGVISGGITAGIYIYETRRKRKPAK